ncbi:MAG: c-type heme family protein [Desulforhopalus sp.]
MNLSFTNINLRKKFLIFSTCITIGFALLLSAIYYSYMKKVVVQDALEKSNLILQEVEAIRSYVKEELRPKMFQMHGEDKFILEAMSTTYISIRIMKLFQSQMKGYTYRRVAQNPLNKDNSTTPWEDKMFDWFEADKSRLLWQGQVKGDQTSSFVTVIPDYMEAECLRCHGKPADAPASLIEKYGDVGGFRFKEGDLAGLNSVAVPIAAPLSRLTTLSGVIFLITLVGSLVLLLVINVLFDKLVVSRLARVVDALGEGDQTNDSQTGEHQQEADELDSLQSSFQQLNSYVRTARRGDNLQPNFIGSYVVGLPIATGAMSWLYRGHHNETGEKVLLKIPFNNIYTNPLYRAWYHSELQLQQYLVHPCLMNQREQIEDIVVFDDLKDAQPLDVQALSLDKRLPTFFTDILDLVAYLHTKGIVHHDLRPENFFISRSLSPVLVDFGLAHQGSQVDIIFESGMGPQGDFNYIAPELLKGLRGDPRSDIYSVGVMLYYFTTGVFFYEDAPTSIQGWLAMKRKAHTVIQRTVKLSPPLKNVINRAMHFDPEERYQWIEDMRDDYLECSSRSKTGKTTDV